MEVTILEMAAKVGTPLALAGLTVAILFLLYRALLRSKLLSTVGKSHTFQILNRIIVFVFILSLISIVLGIASFLLTSLVEPARKTSALEITDVSVVYRSKFPVLDLKFRNVGRDVAYIKKVSIEILDKKIVRDKNQYYAKPSTWQYSVIVDPNSERSSYDIFTSQVISSNETDRFTIVIGQESGEFVFVDYKMRLRVFFNESQVIETREVKVRVHSPKNFLKPSNPIGTSAEDYIALLSSPNPLLVSEISTILGAIGSKDSVQPLLEVLMADPERFISYHEKNILTKPYERELFSEYDIFTKSYYEERRKLSESEVEAMYTSIFWALNQITGNFHDEVLQDMPPRARMLAIEALKRSKELQ